MGEDVAEVQQPLPSNSRCHDSTKIEGDVIVESQEQLAELEGCTEIGGDFAILPFEGADLRPLHALTSIFGVIDIGGRYHGQGLPQYWLESLAGLESLESAGELSVSGLMADNVDALSSLRTLTWPGTLTLQAPNLVNLEGLRQLRGIRSLYLLCYALESLEPLLLPRSMGWLTFSETPLTRLAPLDVESAESVGIMETGLVNLDAFSSLKHVAGSIDIETNRALENVDGLSGVQTLGGLRVHGNPRLERLPDFPEVIRLDRLDISANHRLANTPAFPKLWYDYIVGDAYLSETPEALILWRPESIQIEGNRLLTKVALPAGWFSAAWVTISDNAALTRLEFTKQRSVDYLVIENNPALASVELGVLDTVATLELTGNARLDTSVFDSVRTFERHLGDDVAP